MENESNKMTAVEWVLQYLNNVKPNEFCSIEKIKELLEQAKEMEKQQHKNTWTDSRLRGDLYQNQIFYYESFNDYFKLEYGGNNEQQ